MHGGSVEAHSDGPGRGSEFVVRLPIATERRESAGYAQPRPVSMKPSAFSSSTTTSTRRKASRSCSGSSARKSRPRATARRHSGVRGVQALGRAAGHRDAGNGRLRGHAAHSTTARGADVMVIAQTGWGQEEDRLRSKEAGIDHHLVKPVDLSVLETLLGATPAKL
jgi:hypothetical protein